MCKKLIILLILILLTSCSSPNENDVVVYEESQAYNESIFPNESPKVTNTTTEKINNEINPKEQQYNINLFKDKPDKLKQIMLKPRGIAIDKKGNIFLVDQEMNKILKFDTKGKFLLDWGSTGSDKEMFKEPKYISINDNGDVIISDTWNGRLQIFNNNGNYIKNIQEQFFGPKGNLIKGNNIYLADTGNHCIKIINEIGKVIKIIGSKGEKLGEFNEPTGLAFDNKGNLYVVDSKNNRIVVIDNKFNFIKSWNITKWTDKEEGKECWIVIYKDKLYMSDPITNSVRVFELDGNEKATLLKDLRLPSGLFIYKDQLYVVEGDIPRVTIKKLS